MEPALHHGDSLVLGKADPASVQIGEVVWALHEGWPIMHRVVDIYTDARGERIVITKGDNLPEADPPVKATDVGGRLVLKVPALGAAARVVGLEDGFRMLVLLVQGFAASSIVFGLVYLQDVKRGRGRQRARTARRVCSTPSLHPKRTANHSSSISSPSTVRRSSDPGNDVASPWP